MAGGVRREGRVPSAGGVRARVRERAESFAKRHGGGGVDAMRISNEEGNVLYYIYT